MENADGTYTYADNGVVGVAPDAQVVVMKVFGKNGGAYADDYIAAIEDAIVLDCDSVNLSLGSAAVGFTTPGEAYFDNVMDSLDETDTVVCMSAGNSGNWAEDSVNGLLFAEDSNTGRVGSPRAYEKYSGRRQCRQHRQHRGVFYGQRRELHLRRRRRQDVHRRRDLQERSLYDARQVRGQERHGV